MTDTPPPGPGRIAWTDLTIENAEDIRDFYQSVVGWNSTSFDMGGYEDYCMSPPDEEMPVAGVCHARGKNADLPAQWLIYITVKNLDAAIAACSERGGEVIAGPRKQGETDRYCVIRDPAGAVCGLYESGAR